jgi:uncharacterized protein YdeI (YjbR/CyaY-like superfamily)
MSAKNLRTLDVRSRHEWRNWLQEHHSSESEVWLIFQKSHSAEISISYDAAVEEALCFGWIDSLVTRLDDQRYARKFTPRKPNSRWSTMNRQRYADLKARGLLAAPGLERGPTDRSGDAPRPSASAIPPYIENELEANQAAWKTFQRLAPSYRRQYVAWIDSAKQQKTKEKRLHEAVSLLAAGKKLGLK